MNDLEITKLCAEAMGYSIPQRKGDYVFSIPLGNTVPGIYWPLEDDAQAMALVKKFPMQTTDAMWHWATHNDIVTANRAICVCVAKTQAAK